MTARRVIAVVLIAGVGDRRRDRAGRSRRRRSARSPRRSRASAGRRRSACRSAPIGPVTIAARADDPGGATPWAVRRLTTRTRGDTYSCLQLGRLDGEKFGWIAPGQPFRAARFDLADVPSLCGVRFFRGLPQLSTLTLTTDASRRPARTRPHDRLGRAAAGIRPGAAERRHGASRR